MTIQCLFKKCISEELPCDSFLRTRKKPFLFYFFEQVCIRLRKFSKRTNVEQNFNFFTFASQCHFFFSVICYLKTIHSSVHRFNSFFFSRVEKVHPHHFFSPIKKHLSQQKSLKTLKIYIYIWINFSLRNPCCEINYGRTQNWKIARSF